MADNNEIGARNYVLRGAYFQMPLILVWMARGMYFAVFNPEQFDFTTAYGATSMGGLLLMFVSLLRIYTLNKRPRKLITSDIFSLTRHPMYHGMFLADVAAFFVADFTSPVFWASWFLFMVLLFGAGWYQEKETLARWGSVAKDYYARTPRFIFEWLWRWAI